MPYGLRGADNATLEVFGGKMRVKDQGLDARKTAECKTYSNPSTGFTIDHENRPVVHIIFSSAFNIVETSATTAIADGSVVGQKLKIIVTCTSGIIVAALIIKNNANTKLLGDWFRGHFAQTVIPSWIELVWDGADWQQTNTNDGSPTAVSGPNAHAEGIDTTSSAAAAHAEGANTLASGEVAHVQGSNAVASQRGQHAESSGWHAANGDAQYTRVVVRDVVTHNDANWRSLYLDGGSTKFLIAANEVMTFDILLVGTTAGCSKSFGFAINGVIENDGGSTSLLASNVTTLYDADDTDFDARVVADDTNDALDLQVKDSTSGANVVRWTAVIRAVTVTFPA